MKTSCILIAFLVMASSTFAETPTIVPQPDKLILKKGNGLALPASMRIAVPNEPAWKEHVEILGAHIERLTAGAYRMSVSDAANSFLTIRRDNSLSSEAYSLEITAERIRLAASSIKGLSHGTATLLQIIGCNERGVIPQLSIEDAPKLSYRNFLIDMGRNPQSIELLKETIDLFWFYKIDSIQLHLTDDQRFAFPSTAFPELWDGKITLQRFKELEAYAVARGVTLIPELEVPGHSGILRRQYPEVFGTTPTDLAKSETALKGIKTLLDEMMQVFSSTPYIHVGGDEAYGVPQDLQRNLINQLHAYLKSKGRQTVVWEGPHPGQGENKVNTEVIHLNWRTIEYSAAQMLKDGYRVVNAAWDPLYIVDHYPRTNFTMTSPQHIYETLSLTRFKHVNPGIPTFARPIDVLPSDQLIGFCMPWWEGREANFFPQIVPRVIPFAEVAWNPEVARDYAKFSTRAAQTEAVRQAAFYPVRIEASHLAVAEDGVFHNETTVTLDHQPLANSDIKTELRFTLDGSHPHVDSQLYEKPILLTKNATIRAASFAAGRQIGHGSRRSFTAVKPSNNLALGKPATSSVSSGSPFSVGRITDGGTANLDFYLGYPAQPEPITITVDLETVQKVSRVTVFAYTISGSFEKYTIAVSVDGKQFDEVASRLEKPEQPTSSEEHKFASRDVRFVRINSHGNHGYVFDSFSKLVEVQVHP